MNQKRRRLDPDDEFWLEFRALLLSLVALLERAKLKGHITIPISAVRKKMQAEGWEPPEGES